MLDGLTFKTIEGWWQEGQHDPVVVDRGGGVSEPGVSPMRHLWTEDWSTTLCGAVGQGLTKAYVETMVVCEVCATIYGHDIRLRFPIKTAQPAPAPLFPYYGGPHGSVPA